MQAMITNMNHWLTIMILAVVCLVGAPKAIAGSELVIIVNKDNPVSQLTINELKKIYLGKQRLWGDGETISLYDYVGETQDGGELAREVFVSDYLEKSLEVMKRYWIRMIFSGRGHPPFVVKKPDELIAHVKENRGSIGYIFIESLTDEVKAISITGRD
jgi:ABC-type phosphate transport system substrate-binding protein